MSARLRAVKSTDSPSYVAVGITATRHRGVSQPAAAAQTIGVPSRGARGEIGGVVIASSGFIPRAMRYLMPAAETLARRSSPHELADLVMPKAVMIQRSLRLTRGSLDDIAFERDIQSQLLGP